MHVTHFTASGVAHAAKLFGLPVLSYSEPDETEDGTVDVTGTVHIQVGETYLMACVDEGDFITFGKERTSTEAVLRDVRKLLNRRF